MVGFVKNVFLLQIEPAHDKTYNKTCATSEDSDQPAHPRSLIRIFADRMCLLQPPGYPKQDKRESLPYWMDIQASRFCWSLLVTQVLLYGSSCAGSINFVCIEVLRPSQFNEVQRGQFT